MEQVAIDRYNLSKAMVNNKEKIGEPKAAFKDMVVSVSMGMIQITPNTLPSIRGIKLDPNTILPTDEELRILSNLSALDPYPSVYEQEGIKKKVKGVWL
jgi:DNA-binding protein YbaB